MLLDFAHMVAHTRVSVCYPAASPYGSKKFYTPIYLFPIPPKPPSSSHPYCDSSLEENYCPLFFLSNEKRLCLQSQLQPSGLSLPLPQLPTLSSFSPGSLPFPLFSLFLSFLSFIRILASLPFSLSPSPFNSLACLLPSFLSPPLSRSPSSLLP